MNNHLIKPIASIIVVSSMLTGFGVRILAEETTPFMPEENPSEIIYLDFKDIKDIKDLPSGLEIVPYPFNKEQKDNIKVKIKSVKTDSKLDKEAGLEDSPEFRILNTGPSDPVYTGTNWLKRSQDVSGSWNKGAKTETIDTLSVLTYLKKIEGEGSSTEYVKGIDWLNLTYPENNDYLAEKTTILSQAGQDTSFLSSFLASQINESDNGFGFKKDYHSDIITTSKVLKMISSTNYVDPGNDPIYTLKSVLIYILTSQNPDGGWPKIRGGLSDIKTTALVLDALKPYKNYSVSGISGGDIIIKTKIDLGINYLKNTQSPDGTWFDLETTSIAYDVLIDYNQPPAYNQETLNYILSNQTIDGYFINQDIYLTAKALQSLAKPDISVSEIANISQLNPNEPATIRVVFSNIGYYNSEPINFNTEPHHLHLIIDSKEVALEYGEYLPEQIILSHDSEIELEIEILNMSYGSHRIEFVVDYSGVEFEKDNNQKSVELFFDNQDFNGPEPPTFLGSQTHQNPNSIMVYWNYSKNPSVKYYRLFVGTSSGIYSGYYDLVSPSNTIVISNFSPDTTYYFSVAALYEDGQRGDYSMETYAKAYNNPDEYKGTINFSPKDNNGELLYDVSLLFFVGDDLNTGNSNPVSITRYPGHYWLNAYKSMYSDVSQKIEFKADQIFDKDLILKIVDYYPPDQITSLRAYGGDGEITLKWFRAGNSDDFKNFNIYRSNSEITNVSQMIPIDTSIVENNIINQFIDNDIINGLDYYYAVTMVDKAGNEDKEVIDAGPVRANSAPIISNITAFQDSFGRVQVQYDSKDNEQTNILVELEYFTGIIWQKTNNTQGTGLQNTGSKKLITWDVKSDYPDYEGNLKIRIKADDKEPVNNTCNLESNEFSIDTLGPSNLSVKVNSRRDLVVDLDLYADSGVSEMSQMRFSNDSDFNYEPDNWSAWEPYSDLKQNFVLPENTKEGKARIIVEFKDSKSNTVLISKDISGLIAYYSFELNADDLSGNQNNGIIYGSPVFTEGKSGEAIQLDGTDDYVKVNSLFSNPIDGMTWSAWVKSPKSGSKGMFILDQRENNEGFQPIYIGSSGDLQFYSSDTKDNSYFDTNIKTDTWHHIVMVLKQNNVYCYVNGNLIAVKSDTQKDFTAKNLFIGTRHNLNYYYEGIIDELKVWGYALEEDKIKQEYEESGLISYYAFEDNVRDSKGENNGILFGSPQFIEGKSGKAIRLDGIDDYVKIPYNPSLYSDIMTISFWAKSNKSDYAINSYPISMWDYAANKRMWALYIPALTDKWSIFTSSDGGYKLTSTRSTDTAIDTNWHKYDIVSDNLNKTWHIYIDGAYSQTLTQYYSYTDKNSSLTVGGLIGNNYFDGLIDEVKIYNYCLDKEKIKRDYEGLE
ncbi:MAG: prenyltransferase/squalene oxidase repeat-containing protein [Candidatus Pacebacteria bacterium]|nr:prenyltransferase/squalene oxidase repeat-containing protein [Candidatus Paceibacterota bacterium]